MVYLLFIDCLDTIRIHHLIFSNLPSHTQNSIIAPVTIIFFKKLNSPNWLKVLEKEGVFNNPYGVIPYDEWVQIPIWGPSRYLVKVAKAVPKETLSIIQSIPDTNNLKIYEDFIDAADLPRHIQTKIK
ncbi:hypothetical protein BE845_14905 (plasmid) [Legionella pneumophila subsp. pneumophila]|nr:hypothetical protein BE845_14905 [Legionella pneumophila subsp. pneumophila]